MAEFDLTLLRARLESGYVGSHWEGKSSIAILHNTVSHRNQEEGDGGGKGRSTINTSSEIGRQARCALIKVCGESEIERARAFCDDDAL